MIGHVRRRVVAAAVLGYVGVHVLLGLAGIGYVTWRPPYLLALALVVAASLAVVPKWPARVERWLGPVVVVATTVAGILVVLYLKEGRPGYALWYPSLVLIPLSGIALRGRLVLALVGAAASAATTLWWASGSSVGFEDGIYRVVTPTAAVVVAAGIATLVRQYAQEVDRSHREQEAAARLSAAAEASQTERADRLAEIDLVAAPLLRKLASGAPVDERTATESRLVEAALRDGIRGRGVAVGAVRETVWAARSRGVQVTVLDDAGLGPADPEAPAAGPLRACAVTLLEMLESGVVTIRLAAPDEGTIVVVDPRPAAAVRARAQQLPTTAGAGGHALTVDVGEDEVVVQVRTWTTATHPT